MDEMESSQQIIADLQTEIERLKGALAVFGVDAQKPLREVIRERRLELGMSQSTFARQIGIASNYVSMIENGRVPVPRLRLNEIVSILGLDFHSVLAAAMLDDVFRKKFLNE